MSKLDIIIPIFNSELYLNRCLDSIINQTYDDFCLILIDDGSTDNSSRICDDYSKMDNRIKVIHKKNAGVFQARMTGINSATSDYIMFVDSDDWIDKNYIESMLKNIQEETDVVISGLSRDYDYCSEWINQRIGNGVYNVSEIRDKILPYYINDGKFQSRGICPGLVAKIYRREYFVKFLYLSIDIKYGEDFNLIVPIIYNATNIIVELNENCIYHYRMTKQSLTNSYCENMFDQVKALYKLLFDYFSNEDLILQQLYSDYIAAINQCYKNECKYNLNKKNRLYNINTIEDDDKFKKYIDYVNIIDYPLLEKIIIKRLTITRKANVIIDKLMVIIFHFRLKFNKLKYIINTQLYKKHIE